MTTSPTADPVTRTGPGPHGHNRRRVAVFGGGIAGMTAAHELAERGFQVQLYERHNVVGGKARGFGYPGTGTEGRPDLPGNSGGHFFLGFYPNVGDTLARIPIGQGRTVLDNLTGKGMYGFGAWGEAAVRIPLTASSRVDFRSLYTARSLARAVILMGKILYRRLTPSDIAILASKAAVLATCGQQRRWGQLEHLTNRELLRTDRLSREAQRVAEFLSNCWVANAQGGNARVLATIAAGFVDSVLLGRNYRWFKGYLSVLNNPENQAWFDPWTRHLQGLGATFHLQHTLTHLSCDNGRITGATVHDQSGREHRVVADWYVLAVPADRAAQLMTPEIVAIDPMLGRIERLEPFYGVNVQIFLKHKVPELGVLFMSVAAPWENGNEVLTSVWRTDLSRCGDGQAVECVSVQITDTAFTQQPGLLYGKPAKDCTRTELIDEVLAILRRHLPNGEQQFAHSAVHSCYVSSWVHDGQSTPLIVDEPLFAATRSCWQNQPDACTKVANLFIAGAYTRAIMSFDNMDAANESGKRAANGVIQAAGAASPPIMLPSYTAHPLLRRFHRWDDRRYAAGKPNIFDLVAPSPIVAAAHEQPNPNLVAANG